MGLQLDFGGFNPDFLGVSIKFQNLENFELHRQFCANQTPIRVDHLQDDDRFSALSIISVIGHETRHLHDFFLTSYSAQLFYWRTQMLLNFLQVMPALLRPGPNCLPVPILKWCRMDASVRLEELLWLSRRADEQPWIPVELPYLPATESLDPAELHRRGDIFAALLAAVQDRQEKIRDLTFNPNLARGDASFQAWQVFELSALVVQYHEIRCMYGEDKAWFWLNHLAGLGANPYAQALRLVLTLWEGTGRAVDFDLVSAMTHWSLMGSFKADTWNACPAHRFAVLFMHLKKTGLPSLAAPLLSLFDHWSERTGLSRVEEGIADAQRRFAAVVDTLSKNTAQLTGIPLLGENLGVLRRITAGVSRAADHMAECFLAEPERYVFPHRYSRSIDQYVNPVVRKIFDGMAMVPSKSEAQLEKEGYIVEAALRREGRLYVKRIVEPCAASPHNFFSAPDVIDFDVLQRSCNYLVAETGRLSDDLQSVKAVAFADQALQPFELIG